MSTIAPRINSNLLPNFVGRSVTFVGRISGGSGHLLHLEGSDGGNVVVDRSVSDTARPWQKAFVEVVGVVNHDRTIRESRSTDFGDDFGMNCKLSNLYNFLHQLI